MTDHPDGPTEATIDVQCNPNIRRLTVHAGVRPQLAPYLKYLLSSISSPSIQQITFSIVVLGPTTWQGWNGVDNVLAGVKFGRLREVTIVVNTDQDMDIIRQHLTDQFPSMYDKGILNIREPSY
jgi:hypothetical protein